MENTKVKRNLVSRTERFAVFDGDKVVSRAYVRVPYDESKPLFIFKVKTNKSHIRQGLCRKVIEHIIESHGEENIELRPHQTEKWGAKTTTLIKFYRSFGFKRKKSEGKVFNTMRRNADEKYFH